MAWYYCSNVAHAKPPLFTSPFGAPTCTQCAQATVAAHDVVRHTKLNDYQILWHDTGAELMLRVEVGNRRILLSDDVLATDTVAFAPTLNLKPPGGGEWFSPMSTYGGGHRHNNVDNGLVAPGMNRTTLKLGQNDVGSAYGMVHVVRGHPQMFNNLVSNPPVAPATFDLANLRDNLRAVTAQPGVGVGVRWVAKQINNGRYVIHGVSASTHQHAMLVVDNTYKLITGYPGQNMGGLGQAPVKIREW